MNPVRYNLSHTDDVLLTKLVAILESIECEELFTSHNGQGQAEQARIVRRFQDAVVAKLRLANEGDFEWHLEHRPAENSRDAIDVFGISKSSDVRVIIELDKNRADQVAKKFLSRTALFHDQEQIYYISLCYPGTKTMSLAECKKYFRYCCDVSKKLGNVYASLVIPLG